MNSHGREFVIKDLQSAKKVSVSKFIPEVNKEIKKNNIVLTFTKSCAGYGTFSLDLSKGLNEHYNVLKQKALDEAVLTLKKGQDKTDQLLARLQIMKQAADSLDAKTQEEIHPTVENVENCLKALSSQKDRFTELLDQLSNLNQPKGSS